MRLRIISNGDPRHTEVMNADTGERIDGVMAVEWRIDADSMATATIKVGFPSEVALEADVSDLPPLDYAKKSEGVSNDCGCSACLTCHGVVSP